MHAKDAIVDNSGDWKEIEDFVDAEPEASVTVKHHTIVVKSVNLIDCATFVISSDEVDFVGVADFQKGEVHKSFN